MSSRPFRLLVVADDRKILRRLSRFLKVFGFLVDPVADGDQAIAVYDANPPDFLIVDGDSLSLEHCRQLFSKSRNGYTYTFLMVRDVKAERLTDALMAGVDDFLAKPLVYGELLARLRSGARVLEYERRMRQQSAIDSTTALLSQSAFQSRLQSELERAGDQSVSCVLIDLDFFDNVNRSYGFVVGDEVLRTVATQFKSMAGECKYLASFGGGRFAALLPDSSDAKALAWAENVREAISVSGDPFRQPDRLGDRQPWRGRHDAGNCHGAGPAPPCRGCRADGQVLRPQLRGSLRSIRWRNTRMGRPGPPGSTVRNDRRPRCHGPLPRLRPLR